MAVAAKKSKFWSQNLTVHFRSFVFLKNEKKNRSLQLTNIMIL